MSSTRDEAQITCAVIGAVGCWLVAQALPHLLCSGADERSHDHQRSSGKLGEARQNANGRVNPSSGKWVGRAVQLLPFVLVGRVREREK